MLQRARRLRNNETIRSMVEESPARLAQMIYPLFLQNSGKDKEEISSLPGLCRLSPDFILKEIEECMELGLRGFCLFPKVEEEKKNAVGSYSLKKENFYLTSIMEIKKRFPEACLMTDVALDPYSSDGHDGVVENGLVLNDKSVEILKDMALMQAQAGSDIIGPSDMMDGRIKAIREGLEKEGYENTLIMSYTAKYASSFYGPFRDALDSAPKSGDKKTYQMNPANRKEALRQAKMDEEQGADILLVKPALAYLDVIQAMSCETNLPIAAYNVSGEYSMLKAASEKGWLDEEAVVKESLQAIHRAGASIILSYHAKDFARWSQGKG